MDVTIYCDIILYEEIPLLINYSNAILFLVVKYNYCKIIVKVEKRNKLLKSIFWLKLT